MLPHKLRRRRAHDAAYWFDLKLAEYEGLTFRQTFSNAIIRNESCLVKVGNRTQYHTEDEVLFRKVTLKP